MNSRTATWRSILVVLAVALGAVVVLAGCGSSSNGSSAGATSDDSAATASTTEGSAGGNPIKVGIVSDTTGHNASWGLPTTRAFQMAIDEANAAGGIDGRKIKVIARNANTTLSTGISAARQLLDQEHVVALAGLTDTLQANAIIPIAAKAHTPTLTFSWGVANLNTPWVFQVSNNLDFSFAAVMDWIANSGYKKVAIMAETTARGDEEAKTQTEILKKAGVTPVAVVRYQPESTDWTTQILKLKDSGAQVVINNGASAADVSGPMKAAKQLGVDVVWAGPTIAIPDVPKVGGNDVVAGSISALFLNFDKPEMKKLEQTVADKWGGTFEYGYVQGYDAGKLLVAALKSSPDAVEGGQALLDALESLKDVPVVGGPPGYAVSFGHGQGDPHVAYNDKAMQIVQYQTDGTLGGVDKSLLPVQP